MEAKQKQGMAALEEYLQEKYVEYYEESEKYSTKIDLLVAKVPNLFFKNGIRNYFVYDGKVYYLINKEKLPDEIKSGLVGGDSKDPVALKNLYDVYGVNLDLTVYYIDNKSGTVYGNLNSSEIDPKAKAQQIITGDSGLRSTVEEKLKELNIEIDPELGITVGDVSSINDLTIDGSGENKIENISSIAELTSLKKLTLKNLNIPNLNGLDNCLLLEYLYLDNCVITDSVSGYSPLCSLVKLNTLYMKLPPSMVESTANNQVEGLGNGLSKANLLENLKTFGIFGDDEFIAVVGNRGAYPLVCDFTVQDYGLSSIESGANGGTFLQNSIGNLTSIKSLEKVSESIKTNVTTMYLCFNNISNISSLKGFNSISEICLWKNPNLISLVGLENNTKLQNLIAPYCGFVNFEGLKGCTDLDYILSSDNSGLSSFLGLENINPTYIYSDRCTNLTDISSLKTVSRRGWMFS